MGDKAWGTSMEDKEKLSGDMPGKMGAIREQQREQIWISSPGRRTVNSIAVKVVALYCLAAVQQHNSCQSTKEIWEAIQTAHEGTTQFKQSKIDMLTTEYEIFKMKEDEMNAITEAKDLQKLTIDELIGNLKTYEMKRKKDLERRELKKEKNLVLKDAHTDSSSDEFDMTYLTRRFQKMIGKNGGIPKKGSSSRNSKGNDCCHKYGKPGHFIKDCPLHKKDHYITNTEKAAKRNQVPDRKINRRDADDNMVKQALAYWGDSSSESEGEDDQGDSSMMVVDNGSSEYEPIFALMAKSDDDEEKEEDEVSFLDVQRNLKTYSKKKLMSLANVLIDAYHSLINEKNTLIEEIGDIKQERDDMVVFIVDLKEQVEEVTKENTLMKNQMKEWMDTPKGKEVASEAQLELESELKKVKASLVVELEKNRQLHKDLKRVKNDLDKSLKWTRSSDVITSMYKSNGGNRKGIGFQKAKTSYNPYNKYVIVVDNRLCTHCGQIGHYKDSCKVKIQSLHKNKVFVEKKHIVEEPGPLRGKYMLPAWAKRSLIRPFYHYKGPKLAWAFQGGSVFFGNGKKGYILGVGKIGKTLSHTIENVYHVNGLNYILLSVSQIYDKENEVKFLSKSCIVTNLKTGEVVLIAKKFKNIYVEDLDSLNGGDLTCQSVIDDDADGKRSHNKEDEDGEFTNAPGEAIDIANGKTDLISQVKRNNKRDAAEYPKGTKEPGLSITSIEVEHRVVDASLGTPNAEQRSRSHNFVDVDDV
ncbi:uncharacterized protein LOC142167341 [Nicotiana tabacum]|uniref:Uncharacterized protein LOC142167341 n=1 Tax=Nicotiana tabacum TaxID=4097 RepID=A0AC58SF53_TOBAC